MDDFSHAIASHYNRQKATLQKASVHQQCSMHTSPMFSHQENKLLDRQSVLDAT